MKTAPTKVVTGKVRLSYAHLFQPHASLPGQDPKYSLMLLIPKSDKSTVAKIEAAIEAAKENGKANWGGKVPAGLKTPLRDGDLERDDPLYKGHYFMNASSKQQPGVVDAQLNKIVDPSEIYSGAYGCASLNFYAYSVNGNKGVGAGLNNVQKVADGEPLGGRSRAETDFTAVAEDFLS